jgi:hypothetical protein
MGWHLAALVSRPLVLHLRQDPLPVATITPEIVHEDHVLAVGFGHELNDETDKPKSLTSGGESQHRRRWPSAAHWVLCRRAETFSINVLHAGFERFKMRTDGLLNNCVAGRANQDSLCS